MRRYARRTCTRTSAPVSYRPPRLRRHGSKDKTRRPHGRARRCALRERRAGGPGRRALRFAPLVRHRLDSRHARWTAAQRAHRRREDRPAGRRRPVRCERGRALAHGDEPGRFAHGVARRVLQRRSRRSPPGEVDRVADSHGGGGDVRPASRESPRPGRRGRGARQGQRRHLRADGQHHAHSAWGPDLRVLRRGPVPDVAPWRRLGPGRPVQGRDRQRQALRGQQPGGRVAGRQRGRAGPADWAAPRAGRPADRRHGRRRAHAARDLPSALRGRGQARSRRLDHVLLQPAQRPVRVREQAPAPGGPRRMGLQGLRARRLWSGQEHGRLVEQRPRLRSLAGLRVFADGGERRAGLGRVEHGPGGRPRETDPAHAVRLRFLRPGRLQGRRRADQQARQSPGRAADRGVGDHPAAQPRRRAPARRGQAEVDRPDRQARRHVHDGRWLGQRGAVLVHHAAQGDRRPRGQRGVGSLRRRQRRRAGGDPGQGRRRGDRGRRRLPE